MGTGASVGATAGQDAIASTGPRGTVAATTSTRASVGLAGAVASASTTGALVMAIWLHLEVPAGNLKQGDRNSRNGSTYCWPGDTPLHDVLSNCKQCIEQELAVGPATPVAMGDAAKESDSYSSLW